MRDLEETAYFAWRSAALSGKHICDSSEQEESAYMRVTKSMGAVTLSEEEGNKILEFVKGAIHAEYRTPEPAVPNLKYCPTCGVDTTPLGVPFSHSSPWAEPCRGIQNWRFQRR